jgi:hypothetical protein
LIASLKSVWRPEQVAEGGVDLGDVGLLAAIAVVAFEAREAPAGVGVAVEVPVLLEVALGDVLDRVVAERERGVVGVGRLEAVGEADELVELAAASGNLRWRYSVHAMRISASS